MAVLRGEHGRFVTEPETQLGRGADGRFTARAIAEKHPTGRKHCAGCGRWRHLYEFSPAKWLDKEKTIIAKVLAYCRVCVARKQRSRTGHQLRDTYDGQVGTEPWRKRRLEKQRLRYRELRKNPEWVQARRDYANRRNRSLAYARWNVKIDTELTTKNSGGERFNGKRFAEYLERFMTVDQEHGSFLNGRWVSDNQMHALREWRNGKRPTVNLATADRWAIHFDLPLWEIEEECY